MESYSPISHVFNVKTGEKNLVNAIAHSKMPDDFREMPPFDPQKTVFLKIDYIFNRAMLLEKGIRFPDYLRFQDPPFFVRAMDAAGEFYAMTDITYRYRKYSVKQIAWTREKISDLFLGLADVYAFARKNSYDVLADRILYRVENEYVKVLSGTSFLKK